MIMIVGIGKLSKELGVSIDTVRRWEREGKLKGERTKGGHRRYELEKVLSRIDKSSKEKITVGYARVSTRNKREDLERQKKVIELYCAARGWRHIIIEDTGSGLNYNKTGLKELIKLIETNQVERLVLNYKDRLLRFGSEIIFELCKYENVEVIIINDREEKSYEEELVEDVLSIITVFSAKLYGSRSQKNKVIIEESKKMFLSEKANEREERGKTNSKAILPGHRRKKL
ncbi:MAG: IS607 family transposase [Candidatus Eremiobacterota bacterium]